ncbi:MAG: hypothetical protein V4584_08435 [Verrucomicrobiota bacterium]
MTAGILKTLTVSALPLLLVSCTDQYARRVTYQLGNGYSDARGKLDSYHQGKVRSFNPFQDKVTVSAFETVPGQQSRFSLTVWAPDIGTVPRYESVLTRQGDRCRFVVTEHGNPGIVYDGPRALTGDTLGPLKPLDKWVTGNLVVISREVGTDTGTGPIHKSGL